MASSRQTICSPDATPRQVSLQQAVCDKRIKRPYPQEMDWLGWMSKTFIQHQCEKCGLWHIWKRKATELGSDAGRTHSLSSASQRRHR